MKKLLTLCILSMFLVSGLGNLIANEPDRYDMSSKLFNTFRKLEARYLHRALKKQPDDKFKGKDILQYRRDMNAYLKDITKESGLAGLGIAVVSSDRIIYANGFGSANKENDIPVSPLHLFEVGSISKLFTGIAIMQLEEKGLVDLDVPVSTYIPDFKYKTRFPGAPEITIRMLMTHQSGLISDKYKNMFDVKHGEEHFRDLVTYLENEYTAYRPEYMLSYSNVGIALLGIVIENVSGMDFNDYIEWKILKPTWMVFSNFTNREYMAPLIATPYDLSSDIAKPTTYLRDAPAGELVTSPLEMTFFMQMILNGGKLWGNRIISTESLMKMAEQQNLDLPLDLPEDKLGTKIGLSWFLNDRTLSYAGKYAGHGGATINYTAQLHILPEHDLAVIAMDSSASGLSGVAANEAMIKALEIFKGIKKPVNPGIPPVITLPENELDNYTGTFAVQQFGYANITREGKDLILNTLYGPTKLIAHEDRYFSVKIDDMNLTGLRFTVKEIDGERIIIAEASTPAGIPYNRGVFGVEYEPTAPLPSWIDRIGAYNITNPDFYTPDGEAYLSILPDGIMFFVHPFTGPYVVNTINDKEAILVGRGRGYNITLHANETEDGEYMNFLGYHLKKVDVPRQKGKKVAVDKVKAYSDAFKKYIDSLEVR